MPVPAERVPQHRRVYFWISSPLLPLLCTLTGCLFTLYHEYPSLFRPTCHCNCYAPTEPRSWHIATTSDYDTIWGHCSCRSRMQSRTISCEYAALSLVHHISNLKIRVHKQSFDMSAMRKVSKNYPQFTSVRICTRLLTSFYCVWFEYLMLYTVHDGYRQVKATIDVRCSDLQHGVLWAPSSPRTGYVFVSCS
jgi:hypothetical protein